MQAWLVANVRIEMDTKGVKNNNHSVTGSKVNMFRAGTYLIKGT